MLQDDDVQAVQKLNEAYRLITEQLGRVIVGQQQVIEELLVAMFAKGHVLLEGVPGLAKTLMIRTLADALSLRFSRIQFTPDLMPSDITGTELIQEDKVSGTRELRFFKGPIFANVILADEINRTPPKTQAALLESMQEKKVSAGGEDFPLQEPFFVLATQNPIEQEGTYPLPEAQLDRFFFNILVTYPSWDEEIEIMKRVTAGPEIRLQPVLHREEILSLQDLVRRIPVADHIFTYAAKLARATRPAEEEAPDFIRNWIAWGAGPRASLFMILAGKARAILRGRYHVAIEDVRAAAHPVLRHRIIPNFAAQSEGLTTDDIVDKLLETIPADERLYDGKAADAQTAVS